MKRFIPLFVLVLTSVSGAYAGSIQFTDGFEGSTLDPFWNATTQDSGSITFPSTAAAHSGSQCVQFNSVATGNNKYIFLTHNFSGPTYGDASVWFYDTAASSSNYFQLVVANSALGKYASVFTTDFDLGPGDGDTYYGNTWDESNVVSSVERTQGWHQYNLDATATSLTMSVDGNVIYSGPGGTPFDSVNLEMTGPNWRPACVTYFDDFSFNGSPVPEPSTLALLAIGAVSLLAYAWRRRR
jgi:hypothetical protein